jgi:anti-sigma factor RsiW
MDHLSDEVLSAFVEGDLAATEAGQVAEHVAGCARCREAVTDLRALREGARSLEVLEPSPRVWQAIQERVAHRSRARHWLWLGAPALAAVVVLAFVFGVRTGNLAKTVLHASKPKPALSDQAVAARAQQDYQEYVRGIEAAMNECRAAMQENPGNARVRAAYDGAQSGRAATMDRLVSDGD